MFSWRLKVILSLSTLALAAAGGGNFPDQPGPLAG